MISVEQAQSKILDRISVSGSQMCKVLEAVGGYAADDQRAVLNLPSFDNSSVDGYALRAGDVASASRRAPRRLLKVGEVAAGSVFESEVEREQCVRIFTGSPLPRGVNAVVMQEDTLESEEQQGWVDIFDGVKPWENVRLTGEDVSEGSLILERGERIGVGQATLLAAQGIETVLVSKRPRVALLSTGSELVKPGKALKPGQIYESNSVLLQALLAAEGVVLEKIDCVLDSIDDLQGKLASITHEFDFLVTTGGVSVGDYDFVRSAIGKIGGDIDFWRVALKPGKPFAFGRVHDCFWFGLPGNPVSSFVTGYLFLLPALRASQGAKKPLPRLASARMATGVVNKGERRQYMRARLDEDGFVTPAGLQASHGMNALRLASALIRLEPGQTVVKDEFVPCHLI